MVLKNKKSVYLSSADHNISLTIFLFNYCIFVAIRIGTSDVLDDIDVKTNIRLLIGHLKFKREIYIKDV